MLVKVSFTKSSHNVVYYSHFPQFLIVFTQVFVTLQTIYIVLLSPGAWAQLNIWPGSWVGNNDHRQECICGVWGHGWKPHQHSHHCMWGEYGSWEFIVPKWGGKFPLSSAPTGLVQSEVSSAPHGSTQSRFSCVSTGSPQRSIFYISCISYDSF